MTEADEPDDTPVNRPLPFRPLRRWPGPPAGAAAETAGAAATGEADDLGWLALLELALDEEIFRRR
ncbi:MAG: hypothetical protein P4M09_28595 [Devosia sp.]|nr:hypothetical protein [Devosia sp.]